MLYFRQHCIGGIYDAAEEEENQVSLLSVTGMNQGKSQARLYLVVKKASTLPESGNKHEL